MRTAKAALCGFLGGTAVIHITPLARGIIRNFETAYLAERHPEYETAVLLITGFLAMVMEPVFYIIRLALSLETHGAIGLFWLAPVGISQAWAFMKWLTRTRTSP
ncbi:MAG: hypothetical protein ACOC6E_03545 [Thermodesulfobacteriota bacterium]